MGVTGTKNNKKTLFYTPFPYAKIFSHNHHHRHLKWIGQHDGSNLNKWIACAIRKNFGIERYKNDHDFLKLIIQYVSFAVK